MRAIGDDNLVGFEKLVTKVYGDRNQRRSTIVINRD